MSRSARPSRRAGPSEAIAYAELNAPRQGQKIGRIRAVGGQQRVGHIARFRIDGVVEEAIEVLEILVVEDRFLFKNIKFSQLNNLKLKKENIKGVIFDLGYSYIQIKDPKKGLSFQSKGNLNMKMGLNNYSAEDAINQLDEKELDKIFKFFGDEKESKFISRNIVKERSKKKIDTQTLVEIIDKTKRKKNFKVHSATKVFQALRILVNKEISELIFGLINATKVLKKDGGLVVVTFHSLEDKIVKYFFKSLSEQKSISRYTPVTEQPETLLRLNEKKAIVPSDKEIKENLPSRSAKLRYAIKKDDFYDFETDIFDQFKNLIEIENFGDKL